MLPVYPIREDTREIRDKILSVVSKINIIILMVS